MAAFNADILLNVQSTGAERQVKRLERSVQKVEEKTRDILGVDKQIVRQRRILLTLSGQQATRAKKRLTDLRLQKSELTLQKRELQQISKLEKQRAVDLSRAAGISSSGGGEGINPGALGAAALAGGVALSPQQLVKKSKALQSLQEFRDRQNDGLESILEDLEEKTRIYRQKLDRFNEVRAKRPLLTSKGTFQPTTRTSRNALFRAREDLFTARRDAGFSQGFVGGIDKRIAALSDELERSGRAAAKAQSPLAGLGKQLAITATAYLGVDTAIRQFTVSIQKASAAASSQQRIRALSEGFDNYADVVEVAARAAEKFNLSTIQSQNAVAQLYGRLRPLGLTLDEVETVFSGFSTAAALTGATAAESAGALLQLSQALGAGALRGEEFNSVAEQAPAVLQAIAREVDKPVGALKQLAKDGELTSDIVIRALQRVEREGARKLAAALDTPAQKFVTLQNKVEDLQIALGKLLLPETIALLEGLAGAATNAATEVDKLALAKAGLKRILDANKDILERILVDFFKLEILLPGIKGVADIAAQGMDGLRDAILRNIPGLGQIVFLLEQVQRLRGGIDQIAENEKNRQITENDGFIGPPAPKVPKPLRERLGLGEPDFNDKALRDGLRAAELADKAAEERRIALRDQEQLLERLTAQIKLESSITDVERLTNQLALDQLEIRQDIENKMEDANDQMKELLKREAELRNRLAIDVNTRPIFDAGYDMGKALAEEMSKVKEEFSEIDRLVGSIKDTAIDGLVDGITVAVEGLVNGVEDLDKALQAIVAGVLSDIGRQLISFGVRSLLGGGAPTPALPIPGRAEGGPVMADRPYLIGERGPELFIPGRSGQVVSNEDTRSLSAAMSRYTPSGRSGGSSGAGGDLTAGGGVSGSIDVSYNVTEINQQRYVSEEQFQAGIKAAAEQGAAGGYAKTMTNLKNNRSTRAKLGL